MIHSVTKINTNHHYMAARKAIPKSLRFEVFKRDSFKCQYCGASAPEVVLEVDHIHPVSKKGGNDILNLITSCFACNSGKSDKLLSDNSVVAKQKQQLDELNERRQQLEMLLEWKGALADKSYELDKVVEYFGKINSWQFSLTEAGVKATTRLLKQHGIEAFIEACDAVTDKYHYLDPEDRWEKISVVLKYKDASEDTKKKAYVLGIIKNRFGAYRLTEASILIDRCIPLNIDMEALINITKVDRSWAAWRDSMQDYITEHSKDQEDF